MTKTIRGILLIANLPIYYLVFKQAFHTKEEFLEALKYYFQPDLLSTVKGETLDDMKYSQKLAMCLFVCVLIFAFEDHILSGILN